MTSPTRIGARLASVLLYVICAVIAQTVLVRSAKELDDDVSALILLACLSPALVWGDYVWRTHFGRYLALVLLFTFAVAGVLRCVLAFSSAFTALVWLHPNGWIDRHVVMPISFGISLGASDWIARRMRLGRKA